MRQVGRCAKSDGRCGCGIVIQGAETDRRVTISELAVSLQRDCSALAAETVGMSILTEVVDLIGR